MQVRPLLAALLWAVLSAGTRAQPPAAQPQSPVIARSVALPDSIFERMQGKSFPYDCTISRSELRYLQVPHVDAQGITHQGELVCHKDIADDLLAIFRQLYEARYPIERMRLIDDYDADDRRSMHDNNTSCFCFRKVTGGRSLSKHAQGKAIDINPRYNPYISATGDVQPDNAQHEGAYKIEAGDLLHRLFLEHGFTWGGSWRRTKDYQHFEHP